MADPPARNYTRHESFYLEGIYVVFLVEDMLFRVPQHPFIKASSVFASMFSLPQEGTKVYGSSDARPLKLEGVSASDFATLLQFLCPLNYPYSGPTELGEWESILRLALLWNMEDIRTKAIKQLDYLLREDSYASESIHLGKSFQSKDWLVRGYHMLAKKEAPLLEAEVRSIELASLLKVMNLRENRIREQKGIGYKCNHCPRQDCTLSGHLRCSACGKDSYTVSIPQKIPKFSGTEVELVFRDEYKEFPAEISLREEGP